MVACEHTKGEHCARQCKQRRLISHLAQGSEAAHDRMIPMAGKVRCHRDVRVLGV
jgi:hypothetical protein